MRLSEGSLVFLLMLLLLLCAVLMVVSDFLGPSVGSGVLEVAKDGFKTVLGATVGALAMAAARRHS